MKSLQKLAALAAVLGMAVPVVAQETNLHLQEVHIVQSALEPSTESVLIRGTTPGNNKIQLRLDGLEKLPNGATAKADCLRFASSAVLDGSRALEVYLVGPSVTLGNVDLRGYRNATFALSPGHTVSCVLVDKSKFNHAGTSIVWYELPPETPKPVILGFTPGNIPAFASTPAGMSADSVTVTLKNTGTQAASNLALVAPAGFGLQSNTCTTSLAVNASCTFVVRFAPTAAQTYSGVVTASATSAAPINLPVSGTGVGGTGEPSITGASFSPATVTSGSPSQLCWNGANVTRTTVSCSSQYVYAYDGTDAGRVCSPWDTKTAGTGTGTCTITGYNAAGATSVLNASITVAAAPAITAASFAASTVTAGTNTSLSWTLGGGATSASVSCTGAASGSGSSSPLSVSVTGTGAGSCTVTASNAAGATVTRTASLTAVAAPSITGASFSPATAQSGSTAQLCWNASNVTRTTVSCSSQYVYAYDGTASGLVCGPWDTKTAGSGTGVCTITGYNAAGSTSVVTKSITVSP